MRYEAYWVNPQGKIIGVDARHIGDVIEFPEKYGLTPDYIKRIYDNHNEKIGREGNAREEIIIELMKRGWIRIRKNRNAWIIQAYTLNKKTKDNIWELIRYLVLDEKIGKYSDVMVTSISPHYETNTNFEAILHGSLYEHNEYIKEKTKIQESIKIFDVHIKLKNLIPEKSIISKYNNGILWEYINDINSVFGIISLPEKNALKMGGVKIKGIFSENSNKFEYAYLIPSISLSELMKNGIDYKQPFIIHKENNVIVEVATNLEYGIGKVYHRYIIDGKHDKNYIKRIVQEYFSSHIYKSINIKQPFQLLEYSGKNWNIVINDN